MGQGRITIVGSRKLKFSHIMCFVVIYEDQIVLVHIDDDKRKVIAKEFKEKRKESGDIAVTTLSDMIHMLDQYANQYNVKTIESILEEDELNLLIKADTVHKVVFTKSHYDYQKADGKRKEGKLVFYTNSGKYKLSHKYLDDDEKILMELRATFGAALK